MSLKFVKLNLIKHYTTDQTIYLNQVEISVILDEIKLDDGAKFYWIQKWWHWNHYVFFYHGWMDLNVLKTKKTNMSFVVDDDDHDDDHDDDDDVILKYNKIWKKLKSYWVLILIVSLFMMKNIFDDELEDSSDETEIEPQWI